MALLFAGLALLVFLTLPAAALLALAAGARRLLRRRRPRRAAGSCPYCRSALAGDLVACARCRTIHHDECFDEARRCCVYACGCARAVDVPG
jgi:hypothetical protein